MKKGEIWPPLSPKPQTDGQQIQHEWWNRGTLHPCKISSLSDNGFSLSAPGRSPTWSGAYKVTRLVNFLGSFSSLERTPCTDFYDPYVKWRCFAEVCAFLGPEIKFYISTPFFLKTQFFANLWRGRKFCVKRALTMATCSPVNCSRIRKIMIKVIVLYCLIY